MVDIGLFIIRLVIGGLILGHGLQKLTGWFDGPGLAQWAGALESMRYRRTRPLAWVHALTETGAGILLVLGALTPLAAREPAPRRHARDARGRTATAS